jgi:hypothetical protein
LRALSLGGHVILFSSNWKVLSFLNVLFFGVAFVTALLASVLFVAPLASGQKAFIYPSFVGDNGFLLFLFIFGFNFVVSAFAVVTLPGFLFFPLSAVALAYRAVLWGLLLSLQSISCFLVLLPVVVLEGEAYVFAAVAGASTGFSWVKPEKDMGRFEAFRKALKRCLWVYVFVAVFLFVAAVAETAAVVLFSA